MIVIMMIPLYMDEDDLHDDRRSHSMYLDDDDNDGDDGDDKGYGCTSQLHKQLFITIGGGEVTWWWRGEYFESKFPIVVKKAVKL